MKHIKVITILCAASFAAPIHAEIAGNFSVTNNYMWRGVSQSADAPAVSAGLDYNAASGFYAGVWASNVDFGGEAGSGTEVDYFVGFGAQISVIEYDVGLSLYTYPENGFEDSNFTEAYLKLSYTGFTVGLARTINSDVDDNAPFGVGDVYYYGAYSAELDADYSLTITLGRYNFDVDNALFKNVDYNYLQLDLTKGDFTASVSKATENSGDDSAKVFVSWSTGW